ncbi:MAG: hypothetical protein V1648_05030 [Candidatus Aenigmatarchaeota archaeon]
MAVFTLLFVSVTLVYGSGTASAQSTVTIDKTFACGSGFSCRSDTLGLCQSTLQPYLKMFNNQYSFTLPVDKPGDYKCTVKVTANHFDFPEGKTDEPNEVTDVSLNGVKVGSTTDSWCLPGSVPCTKPKICSEKCLSVGCIQGYKGDCPDCSCPCRDTGEAGGAFLGGSGAKVFAFNGKVCFKISQKLIDDYTWLDKGTVIGIYNPVNRQTIHVVYRGCYNTPMYKNKIEIGAGFCFACSCTNWCGLDSPGISFTGNADAIYTVEAANGSYSVTARMKMPNVAEKIQKLFVTSSDKNNLKSLYPSGFNLNKYCLNCCSQHATPVCEGGTGGYMKLPSSLVTIIPCDSSACKTVGETCSGNSDCCSGQCIASIPPVCVSAPSCKAAGETCSLGNECCSGLSCTGGKCQSTPSCKTAGQTCSSGSECCSEFCSEAGICKDCDEPCGMRCCAPGRICVNNLCQIGE